MNCSPLYNRFSHNKPTFVWGDNSESMTESELNIVYGEIVQLLSEKKLRQAFSQVSQLAADTRQGEFSDRVYDLEETYRFIRKYTVDGVEDPERGKIYLHLVRSLFELTVRIRENWLEAHAGSFYYQKRRSTELLPLSDPALFLKDLAELQAHSPESTPGENPENTHRISPEYWQKMTHLYYRLVLTDKMGEDERTFITTLFEGDALPAECRSVLVTALTFSFLRYFDEAKLELLLDLYEGNRTNLLISQRCLTGFLLALCQYEALMEFFPRVQLRFEMMNEDPAMNRNVERIMLQLLGSRETEKIKQKIQEEIIPEMIRLSPNIRNKFNLDNLMETESSDDRNPEWSALFDESPGLIDKMEEMARMQTEGADVFLASFGMFKTFPFFHEMVNWFVPFFPGHPAIPGVTVEDSEDSQTSITEALLSSPLLCNSDKYSFSLMVRHITGEARSMLAGFLQAEMEQLQELEKEEKMLSPDKKEGIVSNQYIQDLYRFYRLHPSRNDFDDIFSRKFDFHNSSAFRRILEDHPAMIRKLAEFYFEKGYFEEALEVYGMSGEQDGEALQKAAYCHQKLGRYETALSFYRKAELFEVNRIWNLKKIALCCRNLKRTEEALKVYQTLDDLEPDNLSTIYALGYCYSETGAYQEALNAFFKIEYLAPGNKKVWRPIAWSSFMSGKTEQAGKYYLKLMEDEPDKFDLMNMGHVQWALGKREPALEYYRLSIKTGGFTVEEFMAAFTEDLRFLSARGISREEVPIMLDQLLYSLS